jgi:Cytochrome bd terminal oxidase subunit I
MSAAAALVAAQPDLWAARQQMALSLGWHIVIACFGVGFPALVVAVEALGILRADPDALRLARRWSQVLAVLFAVGAVSGTILSFELGILWPGLMRTFGDVWGLPFAIEGIAFFVEAIFVGIYLYGWDRLPPRVHVLTGVPIVVAGVASAWFVVTANAWMNQPRGFDLEHYLATNEVTDVDPWAAMFNPAPRRRRPTWSWLPSWFRASAPLPSTPPRCCGVVPTATTAWASWFRSPWRLRSRRSRSAWATERRASWPTTSQSSSPPSRGWTRPGPGRH